MRCNEWAFQDWAARHADFDDWAVGPNAAAQVAAWVRHRCGVTSRKQILPGTEAGHRWWRLEIQYLVETNQIAEERR